MAKTLQQSVQQQCGYLPTCSVIADDLPSLGAIASAFASTRPRKAGGLSSIPPALYNGDELGAALVHAPLLLKMAARGHSLVGQPG